MVMEIWLWEIAKAIGRLFLNPLVYWFFMVTALASAARIKQERRSFGHKIFPMMDEMYGHRLRGFLYGVLLSVIAIFLTVMLHPLMLLGIIFYSVLFSISKRFSWLSSAYTFGFTSITLLFYPYFQAYLPAPLQLELTTLQWVSFTTLMGLLLLIEASMLRTLKVDQTFPEIFRGARGKMLGQHRIKRISLIPLVLIWPVGQLDFGTDWWPIVNFGETSYGFILFPLIIGFEQVVKGALPTHMSKRFSQFLFILGLVVVAVALSGFYFGVFTLVSVIIALAGREWLSYRLRTQDQRQPALFNPSEQGIKVLAVTPGSPAIDMDLRVGETIVKVNGIDIVKRDDFYQALQTNRAFCKLEVLDERGELRFVQRALYQNEHHELGIIFAIDHQEQLNEQTSDIS